MSHTADVAHGHESPRVEVGNIELGVTHLSPGEGRRSLWVFGELLTHRVRGRMTGGAYSLFEITTRPGGGPQPHIQHREDESFYVLEGEFAFSSGEETLQVGAGSLLYVPKGILHAHKNVGGGVGRMLVIQTPGGLYERFFEEEGRPVGGGSGPLAFEDHPEAVGTRAVAAEYGIEIPPPIAKKV